MSVGTRLEPGTSATLAAKPVSLELSIETPENVWLTYRLAGPAVRLLAYLVDFAVRLAAVIGAAVLIGCAGLALPGLSMGVMLVFGFFLEWGYYVISEGMFRGRTIGKALFNLRVIHEEGYPLTLWPAMLRNFLRAADSFPFLTYGVAFLSMLLTGRFRRLGDLAARTIVIEEKQIQLPVEPLILERIHPLPSADLGSGYTPGNRTLSLIGQFLGRRHVLTHTRGHEMALVLARELAIRLNYQGERRQVDQYPMAFLARVYATFHQLHDDAPASVDRHIPVPSAAVGSGAPEASLS